MSDDNEIQDNNYQNNQQNPQNNIIIENDSPNKPLMDPNSLIPDDNQQNLNQNNHNYIPPDNQITNQEAPEPTAKPILPPYATHPFQPIVGPVEPPPYQGQPMAHPMIQPIGRPYAHPYVQPYVQPNPQMMIVPNVPVYAPPPNRARHCRQFFITFIILLIIIGLFLFIFISIILKN